MPTKLEKNMKMAENVWFPNRSCEIDTVQLGLLQLQPGARQETKRLCLWASVPDKKPSIIQAGATLLIQVKSVYEQSRVVIP